MATGVQDWSTTAGSNASADANVNWAEGQLGPTVNNSARGMMAAIKAYANTIGGGVSYGGSGNAYTITNDTVGAWASLAAPRLVMLKANHTNTGAATVAVDGLTATAIRKNGTTALSAGDIVSGAFYMLCYDGTVFQIIGSIASLSSYQPLDATLTAIAALSFSSGKVAYGTGTDTFALADSTSYGRSLWNVADEAALKALINAEAGVDFQAYDADTAKTDVAADWSAAQAIRPRLSGETSGTLTSASANKVLQLTGTITAPNSVFTALDTMIIDPGASNRTVNRGAGVTMYVNGVDTASATVSANTLASLHYRSASVCILSGSGVS